MAQVGLVFVSHSDKIADGLVELARQMAHTAPLVAAGGTDEGGIGTSFDRIQAAIGEADQGAGVVVICDLGSAILSAETAVEFLDAEAAGSVRVLDVPLVEGGVAAAVAAEGGADLDAVVAAAHSTTPSTDADGPEADGSGGVDAPERGPASATAAVTIRNRDGLHARPAAELVTLAGRFAAQVTVNGADAKSLLRVISLGVRAGDVVQVTAAGPDAAAAVDAVAALIRSGFGES